eukprot:gnl/TRDRNA2_/TRDRNA2_86850_c0_seq1.p1 gnl/TRDRNA2_/TRDRNA2_86850_c0~~gnl/TRDRNA2_/TRDRNA2_86850_c0_seq1.p1  ORF type:complete len:323 (-),score=61.80 gnl/TRDRNA2_/TRDRNA2_86850_c0_seq1:34-1002(-)
MSLFSVPIAAIFAREFLEATIIIGQYRSVVKANEEWDDDRKGIALRTIWIAAGTAAGVAMLMIIVLGIALNAASKELDEAVAEIIEGVSKVVASVCIAQLSLKIPKWLGVYQAGQKVVSVTSAELWFNVAWNIWREIAEIGAFLIPFFLDDEGLSAIPLSAVIGVVIALVLGGLIYGLNMMFKVKTKLAFAMSLITGWLATGLFAGGCHEFEEVAGETDDLWELPGDGWSHKKFPMVVLKPFGYSQSPTILQFTSFVLFAGMVIASHVLQIVWTKRKAMQEQSTKSQEHTAAEAATTQLKETDAPVPDQDVPQDVEPVSTSV